MLETFKDACKIFVFQAIAIENNPVEVDFLILDA
jgi:hypothetical protein